MYYKVIGNAEIKHCKSLNVDFCLSRPIYIGKNQNPKNLGFLLYRLHCQKNP